MSIIYKGRDSKLSRARSGTSAAADGTRAWFPTEEDSKGRGLREVGGAPRNPAPRNHLLVWIVRPSGCHCTDGHLTSRVFTEDQQISKSADPP